ncbi:MAG: hypothetical protein EOP84_36250 [Verrucomicrobiaceae bacterium]|nr:MAG: hypothetical protein EOP84_36250 [Verrucomicrobiaceae bacterium]
MKDIPVEELETISAEIHEAAVRVGCTHVNITGKIWPGAQATGRPEEAARFVEFSWLRAALINGRAIFEQADPMGYAELLVKYGLEDASASEIVREPVEAKQEETPEVVVPIQPDRLTLTVEILPATRLELERQARAEGITVGELLDWKFRPRVER